MTEERSDTLVARKTEPVLFWTFVVGASVPVVFVAALVVQLIVVRPTGTFMNVAFLYSIVGATTMCALLAVAVLPRPRIRSTVVIAAALGTLAGLAPLSLVLFLRLSYHVCAVLNVLALPWPEPLREIVHWTAGLVWLASTVGLIVALTRRDLRRTGLALLVWSVIITFPTFMLLFLIVYGDPGPNCIPV
jgi:hypothetical protein